MEKETQVTLDLTIRVTAPLSLWAELINDKTIELVDFLQLLEITIDPNVTIHYPEEEE